MVLFNQGFEIGHGVKSRGPRPKKWSSFQSVAFLALTLCGLATAAPAPELPGHFDWRERLGGLTPVKNQGQCGNPWATTLTTALEVAIKIKEGIVVSLSDQQVLSCNTQRYDCNGGGYFDAFDLAVAPGLALETDYPYEGVDAQCKKNVPVFRQASRWAYVKDEPGTHAPSLIALKQAIFDYGAIAVTVSASRNWTDYKGGVMRACGNGSTNHMVNLVGWDDAGGYWIARNSWGARWGENGYFRMQYGCDSIGEKAAYLVYDGAIVTRQATQP